MSATDTHSLPNSWYALNDRMVIPLLVGCGHCLPCPEGINIRSVIEKVYLMDNPEYTFDEILYLYSGTQNKASKCSECGVCVERCPYKVDIIARMREAAEIFEVKDG